MSGLPLTVWLACAAIGTSLPLLWWVVAGARPRDRVGQQRLHTAGRALTDLRTVALQASASERITQPAMARIRRMVHRLTPVGVVENLQHRIALAGLTDSWSLERVLGLKLVLGGGLGLLGVFRLAARPSGTALILAAAMAACGYLAPDLVLSGRARRAQEEIRHTLPDMLDQVTISVDAGLSFEAALARVAQTNDTRLGLEFRQLLQEIRVGVPRTQAFENLIERTDVDDVRHFMVAMSQAERLGVPTADVLRVQAAEMRLKRKQWAEEAAQKLPVKLLAPLILVILPALFIILLGPAVIDMIDTFGEPG